MHSPAPHSDDLDSDEPTLGQVIAERRNERELEASGRHASRFMHVDDDSDDDVSSERSGDESASQSPYKRTDSRPDQSTKPDNSKQPKRASQKSRPREIPSNRPVPIGRDACLGITTAASGSDGGRSVRRFDPRFEEHCGDLRELHVERNYAFLAEQREERRKELEDVVRRRDKKRKKKGVNRDAEPRPLDDVDGELDRMRQDDLRRQAVLRKRNVMKQVIDEQKEAVRQGKKPVFLSRRELRQRELRDHFDQLKKQKGGVSKFIAKRRRKLASKERKTMHSE